MNKNNNILLGFFFSLLTIGCYEDKGNYSYHEINELQISNLEKNYTVDVDDSLIIIPNLKGTLYSDPSLFNYMWEIGGENIAETRDLRIKVNMTPGYKYARYIVTDKETNVKTYQEFGLNVSSSTAGDLIMVLSKYQGRAELSYLRLDKPSNWAINFFQDRYETSLGVNPQKLTICYIESERNAPFLNKSGRIMALIDNEIKLLDKNEITLDPQTPILTADAYLQLVTYPKPEIENYHSEYVNEVIETWRRTTYGSLQEMGHLMEISAGRLFCVASLAPNIWSSSYYYNIESPYLGGYFSPFGYWDSMNDTKNPDSKGNYQAGYSPGNFIVFDKNNGRFAYATAYGAIYSIAEENIPSFSGYNLLWGSATNRPNNTSIAVITNGNQSKILILQDGVDDNNKTTKILTSQINGGNLINNKSAFYMMKYNDNMFFSSGNAIYRYNIMNISGGNAPNNNDKIIDLTQLGYDKDAIITDFCVSRSERSLLIGVSRYGDDTEGKGEEPKGDILFFDLNNSTGTITYNAEKSCKGISGIPIDVEIKYQTHYRNGIDFYGTNKDNI